MFLTNDNKIKWKKLLVATVVTALLVFAGIFYFDKSVYLFFRKFNCGLWEWFDAIFSAKVWIFSAFVAALVFCVKKYDKSGVNIKNERNRFSLKVLLQDCFNKTRGSYAVLILASVLSAGIVVKLLKIFIGRARPVFFEALDITGFYPPSLDWAFNSMPSGHTAVSFAGLVMIGMLAPRYKVLTWTLAILVGLSRIAIGAHWPSDVVFGAFVGMVVADIVKAILLSRREK